MIVQNQFGGGGIKIPAGTWVIVKTYTSVFNNIIDEDFVVPVSGKYRVTVIGEGGDGEDSYHNAGDGRSGGGGGSGGWASSILTLTKGQKIPITCASAISSFGNYLSAISGKAASGKNGGAAGTASGGNEHNFSGIKGKAGKEGSDIYSYAGGSGAEVSNPSLSKFLSNTNGAAGSTSSSGTNNGGTPISEGAFNCFGAGGGGGAFLTMIYEFSGGKGGPGAVIIELLLEGVNDT